MADRFNILDRPHNDLKSFGFVDTDWLTTRGSELLGVGREDVGVAAAALHSFLGQIRTRASNYQRTRVYEAQYQDPTHPHFVDRQRYLDRLDSTPGVTLKVGKFTGVKLRQKCVDDALATDLRQMADKGSYEVALLVAGDLDFLNAVKDAQDLGKSVVLVAPQGARVARELQAKADDLHWWNADTIARILGGELPPPLKFIA